MDPGYNISKFELKHRSHLSCPNSDTSTINKALSPLEGRVAGKAGDDRWSSLAFKGASTETAFSQESLLEQPLDS